MSRPSDLPDYQTPPIAEVSIGVVYAELENFKAPHYGLLWNELGTNFSTIQHAPPIGRLIPDSVGVPFPRVLFVHKDDNKLVQLQPDRFLFNWRRTPLKTAYPRYEEIIEEFFDYFDRWQAVVRSHGIGEIKFTGLEIGYVNAIPRGTIWNSRAEMNKVVPAAAFPAGSKLLSELRDTSLVWTFALPFDSGELIASCKFGKTILMEEEILHLELRARTSVESVLTEDHRAWFDNARRSIVSTFAEMTDLDVQKEFWKRTQ